MLVVKRPTRAMPLAEIVNAVAGNLDGKAAVDVVSAVYSKLGRTVPKTKPSMILATWRRRINTLVAAKDPRAIQLCEDADILEDNGEAEKAAKPRKART